jgi:acyl-CoA dehydrogenase
MVEEIARVNATGLGFTMHNDVAAHYLLAYGSEAIKQEWLPKMASGEIIVALALTEPGTGSDLKAIQSTAHRKGDDYILTGQKTFITNGYSCDLVIVAAKTAPELGRKGVSLLLVSRDATGFSKGRKLEKIGLLAQDTSELFFDAVRVPISNRLGAENEGYSYLLHQLAQERLTIGLRAIASIEALLESTVAYTRERKAFGKPLMEFQNTRFKLSDARAQAEMLRCFTDSCLAEHLRGELTPVRAAMVKLLGSEMQNRILDDLLQLHGGYGFMSEYMVGRAWRDARVMRIYGGSSEIMRELIARDIF